MHIRQVKLLEDGSFEERGHLSKDGSLDMYETVKALVDTGFDGYVRPDHGRMIWGESGKPGCGLFDRALGAAYINGLDVYKRQSPRCQHQIVFGMLHRNFLST